MYTILKIRWDNCPWCSLIKPIFENLIKENKRTDIEFWWLKADDWWSLLESLSIRSVPTIAILKDGELIAKKSGVQMPKELEEWINLHTKI